MEPAKRESRQERQSAARRRQILAAAARVFAQKGFHGATTREIAAAADVAEGTLYNYFESKADVLVQLIDSVDSAEERGADLAAGLELSPRRFLGSFVEERLSRRLPEMEVLFSLMPEIIADPEVRRRVYDKHALPEMAAFEEHLRQRIDLGQVRPLDVPLAVRIIEGAFIGLMLLHAMGDPVAHDAFADPARLADGIASVLVEGLAAAAPEQEAASDSPASGPEP